MVVVVLVNRQTRYFPNFLSFLIDEIEVAVQQAIAACTWPAHHHDFEVAILD